jgi:hypothetical protein
VLYISFVAWMAAHFAAQVNASSLIMIMQDPCGSCTLLVQTVGAGDNKAASGHRHPAAGSWSSAGLSCLLEGVCCQGRSATAGHWRGPPDGSCCCLPLPASEDAPKTCKSHNTVARSGGFRSEEGGQHYARIRSSISPCRKQGLNVWHGLLSVFRGDISMPDFTRCAVTALSVL